MMTTYLSLIQRNPIVAYSSQGRARNVWCNASVIQVASMKSLEIRVFSRTDGLAETTAQRLKDFIEEQKIINRGVVALADYTISPAVWDETVGAYRVVMQLRSASEAFGTSGIIKSIPPPKLPKPPKNQGAFSSAFSSAFH